MSHNEYWKGVWDAAEERLNGMLSACETSVHEITGDERGIDSFEDAKRVLAYVLMHGPTCEEKACAILSVAESVHALRELNAFAGVAGAGAAVK